MDLNPLHRLNKDTSTQRVSNLDCWLDICTGGIALAPQQFISIANESESREGSWFVVGTAWPQIFIAPLSPNCSKVSGVDCH